MAQARVLAAEVYRATAQFPSDERYGLISQMRRAAVSIGSNIAEGCGRSGDRELVRVLHIALGSASELEFQILIASDLGFLTSDATDSLSLAVVRSKMSLSRLIKSLRTSELPTRIPP